MPSHDESRAAQIAKDLAYCISRQSRYQLALEIIRAVRAEEREACAKVCEAISEKRYQAVDYEDAPLDFRFMSEGADECAEAIRARKP